MVILSTRQRKIVSLFLKNQTLSSSDVLEKISEAEDSISLVTIKRTLSDLARYGVLAIAGAGRSTAYSISALGRISADIDAEKYCSMDPDRRYGLKSYNFELLTAFPSEILTGNELDVLDKATAIYHRRSHDLPENIKKKELERLIIELSWKSSKIEGNTYSLLDTEKLILENKAAPGKKKDEMVMILNHKDAFDFVRMNTDYFKTITLKNIEEVHSVLVKGLDINPGLRENLVGVIGSIYHPLDNIHQIREAISDLVHALDSLSSPYDKSLLALIGLSYIQPFADGNKRTSRLMANAILIAYGLAPLSYRSIEEKDYRNAVLVFYELNTIGPIKKLFIEQYVFAAENYAYSPV